MGIKVVKFGGSSLADANQFKKVKNIIKSDVERRYVIPSAPGKRFSDDVKVTDMLYKCYETASKDEDFSGIFQQICRRYNEIIKELAIDLSLEDEYKKIAEGFKNHIGRDYAASRGEYLNGIILAKYLGYEFIDAAKVVHFDEKGNYDEEKTMAFMERYLSDVKCAVIPGFYGITPNDTIKTFSRGGSDITGSIVAKAVMANLYENWTDVSGFLMADPRIVKNPKPIKCITYRELRELSYMGATVLHEDAIFPVRTAGIPINIRNTNKPDAPGTMIVAAAGEKTNDYVITGIAGRKGFCSVTLEKDMMNNELGFGRRVLQIFENHKISFEHLPSGIDTMGVVVSQEEFDNDKESIYKDIQTKVNPDSISVVRDLALIAVVGKGMISQIGTASIVFKAVSDMGINIRMIDQGSCELNIIIGVDEKDFDMAMNAIYNAFVK